MTTVTLAVHDAALPTVWPGSPARRGCITVEGSAIGAIGELAECRCAERAAAGAEVIDAAGLAALPGFIDGHRHTWQTALRQTFAGVAFQEYGARMLGEIAPHFSAEDVALGTLLGALTALDSGTTTIVDWAHALNTPEHADASVDALESSGIRAQFAYGIPRDGTPDWSRDSSLGHPADIVRMHERLLASSRLEVAMAARGPEMTNDEVTREDIALARRLGIRISMHVGAADLGPRSRAVHRLSELGLLGPDLTFIHLSSTSDHELALLRDSGSGTCIGPATETLMPGLGRPIIDRLRAHDLQPALSVDTEVSTSGSMFDQLRATLSAAALPEHGGDPSAPRAAQHLGPSGVLELATSAGAAAIGLGGRVGSLAPGYAADIILLDLGAVNLMPATDAVASIVLAGHAGNVDTVIVDGVIRKRAGALLGHDLTELAQRTHESVRLILEVSSHDR